MNEGSLATDCVTDVTDVMNVDIKREEVKGEGGNFGLRRVTLRGKFELLSNLFDRLSLNSAAQTAVSRSKASFSSSGPILEKLDLLARGSS